MKETLSKSERKKLAKEANEDKLRSYLPFYNKISSTVIPPLQSSLGFLQGHANSTNPVGSDSDEFTDAEDGRTERKKREKKAKEADDDDDAVDIAQPLGEEHVSNSFLNTLTMANVCAGMGSLKHLKTLLGDLPHPYHEGSRLIGYSMFSSDESESEEETEDEKSEISDQKDPKYTLEEKKASPKLPLATSIEPATKTSSATTSTTMSSTSTASHATKIPTITETPAKATEEPRKRESISTVSQDSDPVMSLDTSNLIEAYSGTSGPLMPFDMNVEPQILQSSFHTPPEHEWTDLQRSFMDKLDITPLKEVVIIKFKEETQDETETENSMRQKLTWLLGARVQDAFHLKPTDRFCANYDGWLIKDVLLQGQIFLTKDAFCFYSLLPGTTEHNADQQENPDLPLYSGTLVMKVAEGLILSNTTRYWAVLRPETISLYTSPTDMYFPEKVVDLRNALYCELSNDVPAPSSPPPGTTDGVMSPRSGVSSSRNSIHVSNSQLDLDTASVNEADLEEASEEMLTGVWFKVVCTNKTYRFQTGSLFAARHWYNSITKAIFQLHNSNTRREVLHKIPFTQVVEFQKNFILADSNPAEDEGPDDNEAPISFSIKYYANKKLQAKTKGQSTKLPLYDSIHFVIFHLGKDFVELFSQLYDERTSPEQPNHTSNNLNERMKRKAKKVFNDAAAKEELTDVVLSTIQPEYFPSVSLVDKIAKVNENVMKVRSSDNCLAFFQDEVHSDGERGGTMSKLINLNKQVFSKLDFEIGSPKSQSSTSSLTGRLNGDGLTSPPAEDGAVLQLPKPFSISVLKSLNLQMMTTKRSFAEVEQRLLAMNGVEHHRSRMSELTFTESYKEYSQGFLGHSDSESHQEPKKSKFSAFKRKVKTISSMGGVWSANPDHYVKFEEEDKYYVDDEKERESSDKHFKKHFLLNSDCHLVASYYCHLKRSIPVYGKLYLGNDKLCFRSLLPGVSTKMILPLQDVENCANESGTNIKYSGLVITLQGMESLILEFGNQKGRDDCLQMILQQLEILHADESWAPKAHEWGAAGQYRDPSQKEPLDQKASPQLRERDIALAHARIRVARLRHLEDRISTASGIEFPLIFQDSLFYFTEVKPTSSYNITLLTIGSRGDVQPYIALGKGLIKEGHNVTIATHSEFKEWIEKHDIQFKEIAGNPAELMSLMVTHGSMSVGFLKEAGSKFRSWITELLDSSWEACQGADLIIESPSAMCGLHIAEALGIAYMRAFTMPWTRTRAYPHAFIVPESKKGGSYNLLTHVMFENVFWLGISSQVNKWRVETLGLAKTSLSKMQQYKVPFLYNISPAIFPPAVDFPEWVKVTGYWFLDEGDSSYDPPRELVNFIEDAQRDQKKLIYIGFGSIVVNDAKSLTKAVIEAVEALDVRVILNKGWSDRLSKDKGEIEVDLPPLIYDSGAVPHDWLFPRMDAAVHHGGSGTTGATLRTGTPTIIKPFFGDQFFYASRVEDLGVGIALKTLNLKSLTKALKQITEPKYMEKAKAVAHAMEHETGVLSAIDAIYSELAYSKSLMLTTRYNTEARKDDKSGIQTPNVPDGDYFSGHGDLSSSDDDDDDTDESDSEATEKSLK